MQGVNFSGGLLEISALTTLIGSSAAETLALGDRGPVGLPWATMSTFGALSIIKACVTGAAPGWLRETLGVRSPLADKVLGMRLNLRDELRGASKMRRSSLEALGIICREVAKGRETAARSQESWTSWEDIYAFDRASINTIEMLPSSVPGDRPRVFTYASNYLLPKQSNTAAWIFLAASIIKLGESVVLWSISGPKIAVLCGINWCYFFIAAIFLLLFGSKKHKPGEDHNGPVDFLAGQLPTIQRAGGERKIFLGAEESYHLETCWRVVWSLGAAIAVPTLIATYVQLNRENALTVYIWGGFQILWLLLRMIFLHFADSLNTILPHVVMEHSWESLLPSMKLRVLDLTVALAKYQTYSHPRGSYSYGGDASTTSVLLELIASVKKTVTLDIPLDIVHPGDLLELFIDGIVGDPLLNSSSWVCGSKFTGMDLYDCCIVFLQYNNKCIAVPSARVLSGNSQPQNDAEKTVASPVVPRGAANIRYGLSWFYWIPCGPGWWLQMTSSNESTPVLGKQRAAVLDDVMLLKTLMSGNLNISLREVGEIRQIVESSIVSTETLFHLVP